ncbi:MAG: DUF2442 domain-containing protein [bacterium]
MNVPKIQSVSVLDEHTLVVTFVNGQRRKYNVLPLFRREMFAPLKNPGFFKNVQVEPGGYAVVWNESIDISEYELWKNGEELP